MIYTPMTKKAIKLMYGKHKDQLDKSGIPYVFHPFHVAEQMEDESTTIVALLHDIVEDSDMTFDQLKEEGFSDEVLAALRVMTHNSGVNYYDYVKKLGTNPIARIVKIKDLEHNMDISRLDKITDSDFERINKYQRCYEYLKQLELTESSSKIR